MFTQPPYSKQVEQPLAEWAPLLCANYDAILVIPFGGPEGPDQVIPFLENVLRGRNVPRERMLEVAEHYYHFAGRSPINAQNKALIAALRKQLDDHGPKLPIYWGNRNWLPFLPDAVAQMARDGIKHAIAFITSAYSSYSSCRQYLENIAAARQTVGPSAPQIDKLRAFFNHPGFIGPMVENVQAALAQFPADQRASVRILYTAHSIPSSMSAQCAYAAQLQEACRLVSTGLSRNDAELVYQSRSGPPSQPWLEPDIGDALRALHLQGVRAVVVVPIGFTSDHLEVLYDLDVEARALCDELGINMVRASTVGTHPQYVRMIRDLIVERMTPGAERTTLGTLGPCPDICPADCCPAPPRKTS